MDSFLLLVVVALLFVGNRDSGRVGDWGRLGELTAGPASAEVGDAIGILILFSAALATFRMMVGYTISTSSGTNDLQLHQGENIRLASSWPSVLMLLLSCFASRLLFAWSPPIALLLRFSWQEWLKKNVHFQLTTSYRMLN